MKQCTRCGVVKPKTEFYALKRRSGHELTPHCKTCDKLRTATARDSVRIQMIVKYGGKCEICGISDCDVLSIDHKEFGGNIERRQFGAYVGGFYRQLAKQPIRVDLRVLCRNCNWKEYLRHERTI